MATALRRLGLVAHGLLALAAVAALAIESLEHPLAARYPLPGPLRSLAPVGGQGGSFNAASLVIHPPRP